MTARVGIYVQPPQTTLAYGNVAVSNFPALRDHLDSALASVAISGTESEHQPLVNEPRAVHSGSIMEQYGFLDFYNRIHIQYRLLDLGNVAGDQEITFWVMNAYLVPRTLNAVTELNASGLTLTQPAAPPVTYDPLQELIYSLDISASGPPAIEAEYQFDFDVQDLVLQVTGTRLIAVALEPNGPVTETLSWATDVLEAEDGNEQRASLRFAARQQLEYEVVLEHGAVDMAFKALMFDWLGRVMGVPIWFEMRALTAAVTAGADTISVSTLYGDFRAGGLVMIRQSEDVFEILGVESFDDTSITFTTELANSYDVNAVVMPVRTAYATAELSKEGSPVGASVAKLSFTVIDNVNLADDTGSTIYDDHVVMEDANFMDRRIPESFSRKVTIVDTTTGKIFQEPRADRSRMKSNKRWLPKSLQEVWRIRRLLHQLDGSRVPFWLPTFRPDLEIVQTVAGGSPQIRVRNIGYSVFVRSRRPMGDLRILLVDGTVLHRQVIGSNTDGDEEVLTLDSSLAVGALDPEDFYQVQILQLMRIADDKARIEHTFAGTAQVDLSLLSVRA